MNITIIKNTTPLVKKENKQRRRKMLSIFEIYRIGMVVMIPVSMYHIKLYGLDIDEYDLMYDVIVMSVFWPITIMLFMLYKSSTKKLKVKN